MLTYDMVLSTALLDGSGAESNTYGTDAEQAQSHIVVLEPRWRKGVLKLHARPGGTSPCDMVAFIKKPQTWGGGGPWGAVHSSELRPSDGYTCGVLPMRCMAHAAAAVYYTSSA